MRAGRPQVKQDAGGTPALQEVGNRCVVDMGQQIAYHRKCDSPPTEAETEAEACRGDVVDHRPLIEIPPMFPWQRSVDASSNARPQGKQDAGGTPALQEAKSNSEARASRPQPEPPPGATQPLQELTPPAEQDARRTPARQEAAHREWHSRGYLPHFDHPGLIQAITFRLADSIPSVLLEAWHGSIDREHRKRADEFLDSGHGNCAMRDPRIARIARDTLFHFDGSRYRLLAWVIMPNHIHVLIETIAGHPLDRVVHSWKSYIAKEANKVLGRTGAFWSSDYFDRYIRDADHFEQAVAYIHENPVKAGLVSRSTDWPWGSAGAQDC
jgi:REP element-mobilizing transposase RayT